MRNQPIRNAILVSILLILTACQQSGYLKAGVWPSHNEDILNPHQDINKYRFEISELLKFKAVSLEVNPVFIFGGAWPKYTENFGFDWVNCQCNFVVRAYANKNINVYYHKRLFIDVYNNTHDYCNCTYSNEVGVQVNW